MVPEGDFASTPISTCRPDYSLILAKRAFTLPDPHDAEGPHHVVIFILEDVAVEDDNKPAPLWKKRDRRVPVNPYRRRAIVGR